MKNNYLENRDNSTLTVLTDVAQPAFSVSKKFLATLLSGFLCTSMLVVPSSAYAEPSSSELAAEARDYEAQAAAAASSYASIESQVQEALTSLQAMQEELAEAENELFQAQTAEAEAEAKMNEAQAKIDEANKKIAELQRKLGTRVQGMYRNGTVNFLDILLGSASFQEFATSLDLLNQLNESDAAMVQETKILKEEVEAQKAIFTEQEAIAEENRIKAEEVTESARATEQAMNQVYSSLSAEAASLLEQERAATIAADEARAASVVAAASEAAAAQSGSGGSSGSSSGSGGGFVPTYDVVTGNAVVDRAYGAQGAMYAWGAVGPSTFDCSGLVSYALSGSYARLGTTYTFMGWPQVSDPQPGDVCTNMNHCGIYIGNGQMIHAPTFGMPVQVGPVQSGMIFVRY